MKGLLIRNGQIYDGLGGAAYQADVRVADGRIQEIGKGLTGNEAYREIEADGKWLTPGFIDIHTHYDGEVEIAPGLTESLRHGVTSILMGSCGISMVMGDPEELSDMFTRVEGIPSHYIKQLLVERKNWEGPAEYLQHLDSLPLGPNIGMFLGHSTIRSYVMGLGRSLSQDNRPDTSELDRMKAILHDALDEGYLGLSINMLEFDKMDGTDFRSRPTPSVFADWKEYRHLFRVLRERERILQTVPNTANPFTFFSFILESRGIFRKGLKTSMLAMIDGKAARGIHKALGYAARISNGILGANVKLQGLPEPFDVVTHGFESPFFEEFESGTTYLHLQEVVERRELLANKRYRRKFRKEWTARLMPRVFHRKLYDTLILSCPDPALEGKSFRELAKAAGEQEIDYFLDRISEFGNDLRWYTVVGNDRPNHLHWILHHPDCHIGFSDAGAHLKNMAHYNFPLRFFKFIRDRQAAGYRTMTMGQAVQKVTKDLADWYLLDTGSIEVGKRADLVLIDPNALNEQLDEMEECVMPGMPDFKRLVRRNDDAVPLVVVNGGIAWENGVPGDGMGMGQVFRA